MPLPKLFCDFRCLFPFARFIRKNLKKTLDNSMLHRYNKRVLFEPPV